MKKKIFHNWGLKLISLALAFVLWFLVVQIDDPQESRSFPNIPVRLTNTELLDAENKVYEVLGNTDTVRVTIRAPRSITKDLQASDIIAEADMSRLTDINTIAINYTVAGVDSDYIRGDHDVVRLSVEEKTTRWISVKYQIKGEPAENYIVSDVTLDQNRIEVTGPKSAVEKISYARLEVDVSDASTTMNLNVEPQLYDSEDNLLELPSVKKNVNYVHMAVEVLATKEVPIEMNTMGIPAEGYLATGVTECTPSTVKIAGTLSALNGITKISIPEEEMNITGESSNMVNIINIKEYLPENVILADSSFNGRVTATVYIEPEVEKSFTLNAGSFTVINIPEGYRAEITEVEEPHVLKISGLDAAVSAVQTEALQGTVDVAAWLAEQEMDVPEEKGYHIPVTFSLPEDVVQENQIELRIRFVKTEE